MHHLHCVLATDSYFFRIMSFVLNKLKPKEGKPETPMEKGDLGSVSSDVTVDWTDAKLQLSSAANVPHLKKSAKAVKNVIETAEVRFHL